LLSDGGVLTVKGNLYASVIASRGPLLP
jgi:hypothetical protein